ncbi:MAG: LysR family transcriptional regulator [Clostridia bacterium]|nr:LysR family transcriptional regulator [Clostridia bacterium]
MTLLEYRIFHAVVQQGSFARAAQVMHITPSAISHAIGSLEEAYGFSLFIRNRGGVSLTNNGEAIYPFIRQVLAADDVLCQTIDDFRGVQRGTVRIGAFDSVCISWLPEIVTEYKTRFPGVEIEIHQGTYADVINWVKTGVVDIGFLSTESTQELAIQPLYRDQLMCIVPKGFHTKRPGIITPDEMKSETFVVQGDAVDADVQAFLAKYHFSVHASCRVNDDLATIALVESGFGICILPALILERYHGNVDICSIEPLEYREFGIAAQNPHMLSPAVRQMAQQIEHYARRKRLEMLATNRDFDPAPRF